MAKNVREKNTTAFLSTREKQETSQYLKGIKALIYESGLGKTRASILAKQLQRHGGTQTKAISYDTTHILVGNTVNFEKLGKVLDFGEIVQKNVQILRADWLSSCLKEGRLLDTDGYSLQGQNDVCEKPIKECEFDFPDEQACSSRTPASFNLLTNEEVTGAFSLNSKRPRKIVRSKEEDVDDSDYEESDEGEIWNKGDIGECLEISPNISPHKKGDQWVCTRPSTSSPKNMNETITEKLEVLEKLYKNTDDRWRALGYRKAIVSVKKFPKKIETLEECRSLPFVGERLAKKIWEIVETGRLQRLDHLGTKNDALELFCNVWGAGPKTAETWTNKGFRTLDDLKEHGNLNRQQQIGLQHYDDFLERMPRSEAEEIGNVVIATARSINPQLTCEICGSFRRRRATCGDVDVLISHPDGRSHVGIMGRLVEKLKEQGFLTDDLTLMDDKEQRKYFGVCLLPGDGQKHRRLDIIVVPFYEWICALLYFTGSDYLNRSMRLLARKKGMSLSEHSLNAGVVRQGQERLSEGKPLPLTEEKDVFKYLGLDYLQPHERDW